MRRRIVGGQGVREENAGEAHRHRTQSRVHVLRLTAYDLPMETAEAVSIGVTLRWRRAIRLMPPHTTAEPRSRSALGFSDESGLNTPRVYRIVWP